jgi:digeranylgeranylglycerophospholipid reductase
MTNLRNSVAIVGGGPAGCFSAYEIAKRGVPTTVFEEHPMVGVPSHCAGHLSIKSLRRFGLYPLPKDVLENEFSAANFYSPFGANFSLRLSQPVTCAVNRVKFDQMLARQAELAGVEFRLGIRVQSLAKSDGFVRGVTFSDNYGRLGNFSAGLVVDTEGISSRFVRQAGLRTLDGGGLVFAVEAEVEGVEGVEPNAVEIYVGADYAPGFYAWLIPRRDGTAKVGLATKTGNPRVFLERLWQSHPVASRQLKNAKLGQVAYHAITLSGLIPQVYTNGFLAVGDCASQVKPTTGGGVIFSISCAKHAAETAVTALKQGDVSAGALQIYQKRITKEFSMHMRLMLKARRAVDSLSDQKLDKAIRFAQQVGLAEALRDVDEIDFQGRMLLTALKNPATYAMLTYLLALGFR